LITNRNIGEAISAVEEQLRGVEEPYVVRLSRRKRDPFRVLVSSLLSARTKDEVTELASERLLSRAGGPEGLLAMSEDEIASLIYPVGFYRVKARSLKRLARAIVEEHGGRVPDTMEGLLSMPGVGRKTANLVLTLSFGREGICVDTHVHRIVNRWGYVETGSLEETEAELRRKLPREYWTRLNRLLVAFGRAVCRPVGPRCGECRLAGICERRGVRGGEVKKF